MAKPSEQDQPEQGQPKDRNKALLLGKIGVFCFVVGATTSAALALSPRLTLQRNVAVSATPKITGLGTIAYAVSTQGLGAFPGEISASYLCMPPVTATATEEGGGAIADGPVSPTLASLTQAIPPNLVSQFNAAPWPTIHEAARQARVPVLMYHDILEEKEVFFDVTVEEFEAHLARIEEEGLTPITFDQLYDHLRTGSTLPAKPVLLTFDDGYVGHYTHVYPLLQKYQYPAVFSLFTAKLDGTIAGRSTLTWEQAKEMAADPLITIASHSVTHPADLRELDDAALRTELVDAKARLESQLGIPIRYFTYPEGKYDERVAAAVEAAGYDAALTMSNEAEWFAGESDDLLSIGRFGQSQLERV
ncbi:MAG TPA: polysaccharide deacetylase family protein, partial [Candidatus Obscuribacterales bacterium]